MSDRPRRQPQKLTARRVLFQWRFPVIIVLILIVLCCIPVGVVVRLLSKPEEPEPPHSDEMYQQAVYDTLLAEPHELPSGMNPPKALVTLAPDSTGVDHDENGRVLLCTWHRNPGTYKEGEDVTLSYGNITAYSLKELSTWYREKENNDQFGKDNTDLRLQQLLGLPPLTDPNSKNTHFTTFWVNPESVVRPAYSSDVMTSTMTNSFTTPPDDLFYDWFTANALYSYATVNQAWTRMGYTYDWYPKEVDENADNATKAALHFGLTEFLVTEKQVIHVVKTSTTSEFLQQMMADTPILSDDGSTPEDGGDDNAKDGDKGDEKKDN